MQSIDMKSRYRSGLQSSENKNDEDQYIARPKRVWKSTSSNAILSERKEMAKKQAVREPKSFSDIWLMFRDPTEQHRLLIAKNACQPSESCYNVIQGIVQLFPGARSFVLEIKHPGSSIGSRLIPCASLGDVWPRSLIFQLCAVLVFHGTIDAAKGSTGLIVRHTLVCKLMGCD